MSFFDKKESVQSFHPLISYISLQENTLKIKKISGLTKKLLSFSWYLNFRTFSLPLFTPLKPIAEFAGETDWNPKDYFRLQLEIYASNFMMS